MNEKSHAFGGHIRGFEPNPEKPWLLKSEGDIEWDGTLVGSYDIPPEQRTKNPPKDAWDKHAYAICECGHLGGDHRPGCIVSVMTPSEEIQFLEGRGGSKRCSCKEMKPSGEWEKRRMEQMRPTLEGYAKSMQNSWSHGRNGKGGLK